MSVSVPSRGAIFLNDQLLEKIDSYLGFPSPLGELYFLMDLSSSVQLACQRFPSPLGELYFLIQGRCTLTKKYSPFPSPLGELYFLMKQGDET